MKKKPLETAATIVLGIICAGLIFHLVVRVRDVHAGAPPVSLRSGVPAAQGAAAPLRVQAIRSGRTEAYPRGPVLNLALYQEVQSATLRAPARDPFSFPPTPQQLQQASRRAAAQAAGITATVPAAPQPPPIPFQAVGYSVNAQGTLEAYLADSQQVYVVHIGDVFDKGYRVIMITPTMIEIEDESLHRTVEMPFPQ